MIVVTTTTKHNKVSALQVERMKKMRKIVETKAHNNGRILEENHANGYHWANFSMVSSIAEKPST